MDYSSKNTILQQKADDPSDSLGITQSSGLDHHAVSNRQRADMFKSNEVVSTQNVRQHKDAIDLVVDMDESDNSVFAPEGASVLLIRRLTPSECEHLQGFLDGWTDIEGASDSIRYKALGNGVYLIMVVMRRTGVKTMPGKDSWRSCSTQCVMFFGTQNFPTTPLHSGFSARKALRELENSKLVPEFPAPL